MTEGIEIQAQGAHQVSAAAEELDSLAENLTAQVAHFKF
jgi:methyl-accepting chemotaxis protein